MASIITIIMIIPDADGSFFFGVAASWIACARSDAPWSASLLMLLLLFALSLFLLLAWLLLLSLLG